MPVDLSGPLRVEFGRAKDAYEKAVSAGDARLASENAARCARLLRLLADNVPEEKTNSLNAAAKWQNVAQAVEKGPLKQQETEADETSLKSYMVDLISDSKVIWSDIGGLEEPKRLLQEVVVIAGVKKPEAIQPWRGILFFGPPGTGKSLLAAAAAGSLQATFFNVSASKMLSKYFGESSKLIGTLYDFAFEKAPSIVFIDELDSLTLSRGAESHEASRRMLSTLLEHLDGFKSKKTDRLVLTLGATNVPWDLDIAALSRFPRRIYVPLPDATACAEIIRQHTKGLDLSQVNLSSVSQQCVANLFSGRDIAALCQQAIWQMIREENPSLADWSYLPFEHLKEKTLKVRPLLASDFGKAVETIQAPVTRENLAKYDEWAKNFGS